jgi:nucleoside-diphosphate-sugar epimerase
MNVLITGANGFIARALTRRLLSDATQLPAGMGPIGRLTLVDLGFEGAEMPRVRRLSGSIADPALLEANFGRYPPLLTPAADAAGFRHDGDLPTLVRRALLPPIPKTHKVEARSLL